MRMCCREALPVPPGCPEAACPVPERARGPVIVGGGADGLVGCDAGETLWARADAVEVQCAGCPCEATATTATCDGAVTTTCEATPQSPECETECTDEWEGSVHSVRISGHRRRPDLAAGRCVLHGTLVMCDPLGEL